MCIEADKPMRGDANEKLRVAEENRHVNREALAAAAASQYNSD